jgi:hypothetical protein
MNATIATYSLTLKTENDGDLMEIAETRDIDGNTIEITFDGLSAEFDVVDDERLAVREKIEAMLDADDNVLTVSISARGVK